VALFFQPFLAFLCLARFFVSFLRKQESIRHFHCPKRSGHYERTEASFFYLFVVLFFVFRYRAALRGEPAQIPEPAALLLPGMGSLVLRKKQ